MTVSEARRRQPAGLVLAGVGPAEELGFRLQAAAAHLASLTAWPLRPVDPSLSPAQALEGLGEGRSTLGAPAWLAPLPLDPGLALGSDGTWAEGLGAWRQPTLLLLDASQLATGWPAAATALLREARVPLVGLVQWGGTWEPTRRREDGLPWLGAVAEPGDGEDGGDGDDGGDGEGLLAALARRWRALDLL
jgi:hypothetical protein